MAFHDKLPSARWPLFQALFVNFTYSLTCLTQFYPTLIQAGAGMQRMQELLDEQPGVVDAGRPTAVAFVAGNPFTGVKFGYTAAQLNPDDINFTIRAGESVVSSGRADRARAQCLLF
jgi:ABC-type bacteriocin/lantibiotic exporter with double-glycine peptidase domain